jgi:cytidylate kinase
MSFRVVCISRTIGAEGERIGQAVAQQLGFRYVDEQIIAKAAQLAQVDPALVTAAEHQRPLLQRLVDKLALARDVAAPVTLATGLPLTVLAPAGSGYRATADDLRILIRAAIHEVARAGRAVIVAHAASMALTGVEGVLRVLVTASPDTRAHRLAAAQGIDAEAAAAAISASDRERRNYFQQFYHLKEELPTHYDVVINTDVLTPEQAERVILSTARNAS